VATFTLPAQEAGVAKPAAAAPAAGGAMLPSFGSIGGGKVHISADGEINYEGTTGRVRITRNVCLKQGAGAQAIKLNADEVIINLLLPPPGQPSSSKSMFTGSLKSLESNGRVDMRAGTAAMLFDHGVVDLQNKTLKMEMKNSNDMVKIYMLDGPNASGGSVIISPKSVDYNMATQVFSSGGKQTSRQLFEGEIPTNRPAVKK
jgi:hypothetical protein